MHISWYCAMSVSINSEKDKCLVAKLFFVTLLSIHVHFVHAHVQYRVNPNNSQDFPKVFGIASAQHL